MATKKIRKSKAVSPLVLEPVDDEALPDDSDSAWLAKHLADVETVPATELRQDSSSIISRVEFGREELILTRRGKPAAALVPLSLLAAYRELEDAADRKAVAAARKEIAKHGTVSWDDVKRELDL